MEYTATMNENEYRLNFFIDNKFKRNKCTHCGSYFWASEDVNTCAEEPCRSYEFINHPPTDMEYSLDKMRDSFINFFKSNGHTEINRYPVVARWRDDVFFTQASIYDFQPWVTNGVIDPPANPLVISQPCLRFNDIDNVGYSGRHFTFFEMMAHHAFNKKDKYIYYKDKTVELCNRFLVDTLKIPSENVTYKEEVWEGGGNAGPSLSVGVMGVEVATLVFMQYIKNDNTLTDMPLKVVDTGYGLERLCWLSTGSKTAYEAVFKDYVKVIDPIIGKLSNEEMPLYYILLDHSKSIIYMLFDGVVPSNVKEGYFARVLLRRMINIMNKLGRIDSLIDIVDHIITIESRKNVKLIDFREELLDMVRFEYNKYFETLKKGKSIVQKFERDLIDEKKIFDEDLLIKLYESHGLNPEIVKDFTKLPVNIPDDFYAKISKKGGSKREAIGVKTLDLGVEDTIIKYYNDPFTLDFNAKVVAIYKDSLILNETYFYPTGGGQVTDTGTIDGIYVKDVERVSKIILHHIDNQFINDFYAGKTVKCSIDRERRLRLMRHHTGAHLINGAARKILGKHVWQAGAFKGIDSARIDLTHYKHVTVDERKAIENLINTEILASVKIDSYFMERSEAEKRYGFTIYQGGAVPGKMLRIIDIENFDVEACGGTHCTNTSQVGLLKITDVKRLQDGVVRLEYLCGDLALKKIQDREMLIDRVNEITDANDDTIIKKIVNLISDNKKYKSIIDNTEMDRINGYIKSLIELSDNIGNVKYVHTIITFDVNIKQFLKILTTKNVFAFIGLKKGDLNYIYCGRSDDIDVDCRKILPVIKQAIPYGNGGGSNSLTEYTFKDVPDSQFSIIFEKVVKEVLSFLRQQI